MRLSITIILIFFVLITYSQQRLVKKRIETSIWTYTNDKGKEKTQTQLESFVVYDKQGKEIEYGDFGESFGKQVIGKDSSVSWFCGKDYSKINAVDFTTYDKDGRKLKEETWFYKDNKKNWTSGYTIFKYSTFGLLIKEIRFTEKDSIEKTVTYIYDNNNSNNIEIIDSTFNSYYSTNKISIHKSINQFDTLNRIVSTTEFSNAKLLLIRKFLYREGTDITTELRYNNANDTSLWSITETKIGYIKQFPYPKKKLEIFCKVINSSTEKREIYIYNKEFLLDKIEYYAGVMLTGYSKFNYEYY
ncbi:MAG: hypothetical protein HXX18_07580 [Bacteroidetes bacterium]|nr:hypothetical protein [Bacteroidota bacterium]